MRWWMIVVVGLLLGINAVVLVTAAPVLAPDSPCVFNSTVLCAELPPSGAALEEVLKYEGNDPGLWRRQILYDFPFLFLYAFLLAGGGWMLSQGNKHQWLRFVMVAVVMMGACCDVVENLGILAALSAIEVNVAIQDGHAHLVNLSSQAKFLLLCLGSALACSFFLLGGVRRRGRFQATFAICLCGIVLAAPFDPKFYEYGLVGISYACLILWVNAAYQAWVEKKQGSPNTASAD